MPLASIDAVIAAIGRGEMVVLVDDEDRENEGDLVMAAEHVDDAAIAFMAARGRGLICLALDGALIDRLQLPMMTADNRSPLGTAFTVSIEAAQGVTTGISAADRARTVRSAIADDAGPRSVVVPGHVFPLRAADGGVLVRAGQTEGSVDCARLAGCRPAAVICEIMKEDGTMARRPDLDAFCNEHGLLCASVADLIAYRLERECLIEECACRDLITRWGPARARVFRSQVDGVEHLALVFGELTASGPTLVRVQRRALLADLYGVVGPEGTDLDESAAMLARDGGVLLHLGGRGRDLASQISASPPGAETQRPLIHDYGIGAQILRALGVERMRLISRHEVVPPALSGHGLEILDRVVPGSGHRFTPADRARG
ncbi:MAG: 3,4-dihydroxy-2-butanone-4-phosphate synthase [Planctomycetota bacterium]